MHHKGVLAHLLLHCGPLPVAGVDDSFGRQRVDAMLDREHERGPRSSREIEAPDTPIEERVPGQQVGTNTEADRTPGVTRRVHDFDVEPMPGEHLTIGQVLLADDVGQVVRNAGKIVHSLELLAVIGMDGGLAAERGFHRRDSTDMVRVAVGEQDAIAAQPALLQHGNGLWMLQPGIDDQRVVGVATA